MAKIKSEEISLYLKLSSEDARAQFQNLAKTTEGLTSRLKSAREELGELEDAGRKYSSRWVEVKKTVEDTQKAVDANEAKMKELVKQFDKSKMNLRELNTHLRKLKSEFRGAAPDSKEFEVLSKQIAETQKRIKELSQSTRDSRDSWMSMTCGGTKSASPSFVHARFMFVCVIKRLFV